MRRWLLAFFLLIAGQAAYAGEPIIIALSLAKSAELSKSGSYALIPDPLHQPLEQDSSSPNVRQTTRPLRSLRTSWQSWMRVPS